MITDSGCGRVFKMFGAACVELGVRHVRSRPTRPRPTARPSGSASRHCGSGPTAWRRTTTSQAVFEVLSGLRSTPLLSDTCGRGNTGVAP